MSSRSRASICARACWRKYRDSTASINAERDCLDPAFFAPAMRSMPVSISLESVMDVFSFILLTYYRTEYARGNVFRTKSVPVELGVRVQRSFLGSPRLSRGLLFVRMTAGGETLDGGLGGKLTQHPSAIRPLPRSPVLVIMIALWPICATGFVSV